MTTSLELVCALGRGSSSIVTLARLHFNHHRGVVESTLVAIKSSSSSWVIEEERNILHHLRGCPQIIQPIHVDGHNSTPNDLYLEYAPHGSLDNLLSSSGPLPASQVRAYTVSLLKGLDHIHKNGYVHCDIKPDNILVWTATDVKITDFGLAKRWGEKTKGATPMYMAPECVTREEYEAPLDIWSLGCMVVEMMTGRLALKLRFDASVEGSLGRLLHDIGEGTAYPEIPVGLSKEGKDFLSKCFAREPLRRWTAEMLLNHPFLEKGGDSGGARARARQSRDDRRCTTLEMPSMESYYEYTAAMLGIL